jgi:osmotically-inducible protein OsmY
LGSPVPPSVTAHDLWLSSKIKTQLIADKRIDGLNIEIEVENGEVFLMGLVSTQKANLAVEVTRNIKGVKQVIKAFEYRRIGEWPVGPYCVFFSSIWAIYTA